MKLTRSLHSTGRSNLPAAYILENDGVTAGGDYLNSNSCHKPSESITAGPRPSAGTNIIIAGRLSRGRVNKIVTKLSRHQAEGCLRDAILDRAPLLQTGRP